MCRIRIVRVSSFDILRHVIDPGGCRRAMVLRRAHLAGFPLPVLETQVCIDLMSQLVFYSIWFINIDL